MTTEFQDQASTLRQMFGGAVEPQELGVHLLCCPQRPAAVLPLADMLTNELTTQGHTIALADELTFASRESWPLKTQVRFDLSHALADKVPLAACLSALQPECWYGYSSNINNLSAKVARPLTDRLNQSGIDFETLLVCGAPSHVAHWRYYGSKPKLTMICSANEEDESAAVAWLVNASRQIEFDKIQLLLVGSHDDAIRARDRLIESCTRVGGLDCDVIGYAEADLQKTGLPMLWIGDQLLITCLKDTLIG